jgi:hypothetical protein
MTLEFGSTLTSLRQSNWTMQAQPARGWAYCTLLTSLLSVMAKPGGRNGKQRKSCDGWWSEIPIGIVTEKSVAGSVRPAWRMRSSWGSTIVFGPQPRSTGCFNGTSSFWRTICVSMYWRSLPSAANLHSHKSQRRPVCGWPTCCD